MSAASEERIAGLILAAGFSARMGQPKALLDWQGQPLVIYQVEQLRAAEIDPVILVLGYAAEAVRATLSAFAGGRWLAEVGLRLVDNPRYAEGRASSVRAGMAAVPDTAAAVLLLGVDQPRPAHLTRAVCTAWQQHRPLIARPVYQGRHGHPVLFARALFPELAAVEEASQGPRALLRRHAGDILDVPVEDPLVLVDINTPAEYHAAHGQVRGAPGSPQPGR